MTKNPKPRKVKHSINIDAPLHVTGKTIYLDDMPELAGTLYAKVFYSPFAHAHLKQVNYTQALAQEGIIDIIDHSRIPGENQIGGIIADEPLLAIDELHFIGMPILIIVATDELSAHKAMAYIKIEVEEKKIVADVQEAFENQSFLSSPIHFNLGDTESAFASCAHVYEGNASSGGQEHVYLEPQGAYAIPVTNGLKIYSSTQGPTAVQRTVANVLGWSMNQVEVDVNRIGGGFGGKEDQASPWAAMAALAAQICHRPVKLILERGEDLQMTGKRHPYESQYKIGLDEKGKIIAYEARYLQNGGAAADLSPAVLQRTLFHGTNSYYIPHVNISAYSCKTNLPPNTAFRGFGGPQGMFVIEAALHHAADEMNVAVHELQEKNLLHESAEFPYGQLAESCEARSCWSVAKESYELDNLQKEIEDYNSKHQWSKKGLSLMPICFGISFTNTMMNQARALVHVYSDGSVGISTGAVEMGQGVSSKMIQVAAQSLGISHDKIKLETTNTTRVANTSPSAASATADLNGKALEDACGQIVLRLKELLYKTWQLEVSSEIKLQNGAASTNASEAFVSWNDLVTLAFQERVNLSAKGHYATPKIHFNKDTSKGIPFAYHVYGTAITTCTVDCLRGNYEFDKVQIVHDFGASMNRAVDLGQIEGGLAQGIGWMTMEELIYNDKGQLKSGNLANYKIPDIYSVPKQVSVKYLDSKGSDLAIQKSKAVGEPPLMYGIGAYFAIHNAIKSFNDKANIPYDAPMTVEKVLMALYS